VLILLGISLHHLRAALSVPADPARQIAGRSATAETVENIRTSLASTCPSTSNTGAT
jgi:peptide/nickel transport system permease protein